MGNQQASSAISDGKGVATAGVVAPRRPPTVKEVRATIASLETQAADVSAQLAATTLGKLQELQETMTLEEYSEVMQRVQASVSDPGKMFAIIDDALRGGGGGGSGGKPAATAAVQPSGGWVARTSAAADDFLHQRNLLVRIALIMLMAVAVMSAVAAVLLPHPAKAVNGVVIGVLLELMAMYVCDAVKTRRVPRAVVLGVTRAVGLTYANDFLGGAMFRAYQGVGGHMLMDFAGKALGTGGRRHGHGHRGRHPVPRNVFAEYVAQG